MSDFIQLHIHTQNSLLDGISTPIQYAKRAQEYNHSHLAITDHGKLSGWHNLEKACLQYNLHPIYGIEAYLNENLVSFNEKEKRMRTKDSHLILLAKNKQGYDNLLKLNYLSCKDEEHFYYSPRISSTEVFENSEGLIIGTACIGSPFGQLLKAGKTRETAELLKTYKGHFKDDFYVEIQINELVRPFGDLPQGQKSYNEIMMKIAHKLNIPVVLTGDVHYLEKGQDIVQTIGIAIRNKDKMDNLTFELEGKNLYYHNVEDYLKFNKDFGYGYKEQDIIEWCKNSTLIADKIQYSFPKKNRLYLPTLTEDDEVSLEEKAKQGLVRKMKVSTYEEVPEEYKKRLEFELDVIARKGFSSYFLIFEDIYRFANENKIVCGSSRGCFLPGNKVLMGDKTLKNIEDIKQGDIVFSGLGTEAEVAKVFEYEVEEEEIIEITCEDGTVISCTADHLILLNADVFQYWEKAGVLKINDQINLIDDTTTKVLSCGRRNYTGKVYDLNVPGYHTYNIEGKVVHNSGAGSIILYAINASKIDPIKHDLIFERFLSESRCPTVSYNFFKD